MWSRFKARMVVMSDGRTGCYRLVDVDDTTGAETFEATEFSASGWGPNMQHGGPVAGLLTRAIEHLARPGARISRMGVDLLGAVPVSTVRVRAWNERPGRRIALLAAEMTAQSPEGPWRTVATAHAWQLATEPTADVAHRADSTIAPPDGGGHPDIGLDPSWRVGFVTALEWHVADLTRAPGTPTVAWVRLTEPLVAGESPTDLQRLMTIADVANGVGARLDARVFTFMNTDLSAVLFEQPRGEWVGIQAEMSVGAEGIAMTSAVLHDVSGPIGRLTQTVLVQRRAQPLV